MPKKNRAPSTTTSPQNPCGACSRLVALFTGAVRRIGALLAGLVVTWWQDD